LIFIDNNIKTEESQLSVGPRKVASRQPTSSLGAIESPSIAFAKVNSQTEEQYFEKIENSSPKSLQEGNLSNICEGGGETRETEEPISPLGIVQPLSSPDKMSAIKIIQNNVEELEELRSL